MSVSEQITRIQTDRNTIRSKLNALGLVEATATLDDCATAVEGIEDRGAVSANVKEGETYTIPKGYHNGSGTVSGVSGGGNYTLQSKTVAPTKKQQNVVPDSGFYGMSDVTIEAIPQIYQDVSSVTATANDVLSSKVIVDATGKQIAGAMPNNGAVAVTLNVGSKSYTVPKGYHDGKGNVSIITETKAITPSLAEQTVEATSGKVIESVTVAPIPSNFIDTTDADALATNILEDKTAYVKGVKVIGTMRNNGDVTGNIDGLVTTTFTIPSGYVSGGTVTLTSDIEDALKVV